MEVDIKQIAIKQLQEARGFIVICDDEDEIYFGGDGISLNKAIGLIERYKHKMLADNAKKRE